MFSLGMYAFDCKPLNSKSPLQYLLAINPPMCFKNMLFSDLLLSNSSSGEIEHRIKPTEYVYSNKYINSEKSMQKSDTYIWSFLKSNSRKVVCKEKYLYNFSENIDFYSPDYDQSSGKDPDACTIRFESNDFNVRNNEYAKFKLRRLNFKSALSKFVLIYSPYMIVNRTNIPLVIGNGSKKNDLDVYPQTSCYFCSDKDKKLYVSTDEYGWSEAFSNDTIGITGRLSLKKTNNSKSFRPTLKEYNSEEIDIGVSIHPLNDQYYKTIAIIFTPRYVIMNSTSVPLFISDDSINSEIEHHLAPNSEKIYYFETKKDK